MRGEMVRWAGAGADGGGAGTVLAVGLLTGLVVGAAQYGTALLYTKVVSRLDSRGKILGLAAANAVLGAAGAAGIYAARGKIGRDIAVPAAATAAGLGASTAVGLVVLSLSSPSSAGA